MDANITVLNAKLLVNFHPALPHSIQENYSQLASSSCIKQILFFYFFLQTSFFLQIGLNQENGLILLSAMQGAHSQFGLLVSLYYCIEFDYKINGFVHPNDFCI